MPDGIREILSEFIKQERDKEEFYLKVGRASNVNAADNTFTFTPNDESSPIEECQLKSIVSNSGGSFVIIPNDNSFVVVAFTSPTTGVCIMVESAQTVIFNDGNNGGLINIEQLTTKLNELSTQINNFVTTFNANTHPSNGAPPSTPPASSVGNFDKNDYEDENVIH